MIENMCSNNEDNDETIVARFQKDYTEQFYILIRMHLSFLLDLNTNDGDCIFERARLKKWNLGPFSKKSKSRIVINGVALASENVSHMQQLIDFLNNEENLKSEGIFRRTGSLERQQELKGLLSSGITVSFESGMYNVHDCASVLKSFLADLAEPLLTESHFPTYCQIAETYSGSYNNQTKATKLVEILQMLILLLPTENRELLKGILNLLHLTASYCSYNKMDTDNLAKLFMPHLLCPRNLSPEVLLKGSKKLFGIISFMIEKSSELFKVPLKLVLDFRAKYEKKKVLSTTKRLNESTSDAASTVFTFVDQERTAKENELNPTETALAQLYAHIQSLPESSKKRKLVKQFNKENGHGTPSQLLCNQTKNKSLRDVIKRRIFHRHLLTKKEFTLRCSSSYEILQSPPESPHSKIKKHLFCHQSYGSQEDLSTKGTPAKKLKISDMTNESLESAHSNSNLDRNRSFSEPNLSSDVDVKMKNSCVTSTPAHFRSNTERFTPKEQCRRSMSPITRSAHRMSQTMQESMMTPRSRKPLLLLSGTSICTLHGMKHSNDMSTLSEDDSKEQISTEQHVKRSQSESELYNLSRMESQASLTEAFKHYLQSRDIDVVVSSPNHSGTSSSKVEFSYMDMNKLNSEMNQSLLQYLDEMSDSDMEEEICKEPVLKPKQFDKEGKPIVFETSF